MSLTLWASWEPSPSGGSLVVLAGRATSVPFTAVMTGPERTTTDNKKRLRPTVFLFPQVEILPIWLWEQEVASDRATGLYIHTAWV